MPRHAHGRSLLKAGPSRPPKRKPKRNAALNALETAERQIPDSTKVRQHRLGEVEDDLDVPETRADADERSSKRRKVTNDPESEEDVDEGSDLEGGTWHTGVNEDDEDSDLDSDEAFGESDEEKFADFTFRGSGSQDQARQRLKPRKMRELTLDEQEADDSEQGDSDDLGDEAVDLATAWDMDEVDQNDDQKSTRRKEKRKVKSTDKGFSQSDVSEEESKDAESDDESEGGDSQLSFSDDELDGDTTALQTFVEGLSTSQQEPKQMFRSDSKALPSQPSRFGLPPSKLSAADLLQYVKDPAQRRSLKILQNAELAGPEAYKGGIPGKLSAPLAKRQQDKLDRGAAYDQAKEQLNRWIDTIKQNRRAEHLSFPLADHAKASALGQRQLMPTSQSAPTTNLEATINQIMRESGMEQGHHSLEDQEQAFEGLAEKTMDIDEVKARRAELRMARELMFREEIRAKRIKKIKSKAYRRVHRKERDRMEAQQHEALASAGLLNSDDEREKQDRTRAEGRMGARHRESKWAKGVKQAGRATWDESARLGVSDLAKRDEELRRRIMGKDVADPDTFDQETDSATDYSADSETEELKLAQKLNNLNAQGDLSSKSRLGQMAFMQRAQAARKAENDEEVRQLRLALNDPAGESEADEEVYNEPKGRQRFGAQATTKATPQQRKLNNEFEAPLSDEEDANDQYVAKIDPMQTNGLSEAVGKTFSDKHHPTYSAKQQSSGTKSTGLHKKSVGTKHVSAQRTKTNETIWDRASPESEDGLADGQDPDQAKAALAAAIFAGPDDATQEFAKEKAEIVKEEGDQVVDNTLPGWGSWTGVGVSKREQKKGKGRFVTTVKGVAPEKRQDAKLDRVIVNEKRVKKNGKYLATELPHPFESRQQYERSLRLPVGPEWSTVNHYQDSIKPRVLLKQGTAIKPIAKPIA